MAGLGMAWAIESMQIGVLDGEQWKLEGDVIDTRDVFGPVVWARSLHALADAAHHLGLRPPPLACAHHPGWLPPP